VYPPPPNIGGGIHVAHLFSFLYCAIIFLNHNTGTIMVYNTGTKHELAQRAYEKLSQVRREGVLVENDGNVSNAENATISEYWGKNDNSS
jgi:valyl-tRNA synthetase